MNTYGVPSTTAPASSPPAASLTQLCGLSDQLAAAVADVQAAWEFLRYGAVAPATGEKGVANGDRIAALEQNFHVQIKSLAMLAEDIRSRS